MTVNPFIKSDLDLLPDLQPEGWPDILPAFNFYTKSSFCFPIKIIADNRLVGTGTTIIHHDVAWLAHIIVHKEYRKKGIGQLITETLVDSLQSENCDTIYLLATDLGAPVYEKVGFITETEYLFFKDIKIAEDGQTPIQVKPYRKEFKEQIAEIDGMNSGENRLFHLEDHLQDGFVYHEDKIVKGFYLPGFGDGLIIANNPVAGLELSKLHLQSNEKIVFPKDNVVATNYLYENCFKETLTGKRMRLGKKRHVNFQNIYNRIGGNLG
ncbi:MAG: GNAT family N-acetyltransferase [Chitinophagaceae bacterium]